MRDQAEGGPPMTVFGPCVVVLHPEYARSLLVSPLNSPIHAQSCLFAPPSSKLAAGHLGSEHLKMSKGGMIRGHLHRIAPIYDKFVGHNAVCQYQKSEKTMSFDSMRVDHDRFTGKSVLTY